MVPVLCSPGLLEDVGFRSTILLVTRDNIMLRIIDSKREVPVTLSSTAKANRKAMFQCGDQRVEAVRRCCVLRHVERHWSARVWAAGGTAN